MSQFKVGALVICVSALLGACSSPVKLAPTQAQTSVTNAPTVMTSKPAASTSSTVAAVVVPDYLDPKSPISKERSVYFGFDESTIQGKFEPLIQRQGKYLAGHPNLSIRVEGNTDERGGAEYNLALAQKRADAVARALKIYGVKDGQMEAVSLGKEKPVATGHDEVAWAQNRRADLVYPSH